MKIQQPFCPSCGAPLKIRPGQEPIICEYCGSHLTLEGREGNPLPQSPAEESLPEEGLKTARVPVVSQSFRVLQSLGWFLFFLYSKLIYALARDSIGKGEGVGLNVLASLVMVGIPLAVRALVLFLWRKLPWARPELTLRRRFPWWGFVVLFAIAFSIPITV